MWVRWFMASVAALRETGIGWVWWVKGGSVVGLERGGTGKAVTRGGLRVVFARLGTGVVFAGSGMGVVLARSVTHARARMGMGHVRSKMGIGHAGMMGVVFARSGRRPMTRMNFGRLMVVGNVTDVATALDLRLLQRVWYSGDAQNEHEKANGKQDAHFAQEAVGATIASW